MGEEFVEAFPLESMLGSGHDRYKDREGRGKSGGIFVRQGGGKEIRHRSRTREELLIVEGLTKVAWRQWPRKMYCLSGILVEAHEDEARRTHQS